MTRPDSARTKSRRTWRAAANLLALLAVAAGLRLYGRTWGLPETYHPDENHNILGASRILPSERIDLVPRDFVYPPTSHYVLRVVLEVRKLLGPVDQTAKHTIARTLSGLFGVLSVWLVYRLGDKLYERRVGLWAAAFLTFTVLHLRDSHFYTLDVLFTCEILIMLAVCARILEAGLLRDYVIAGVVLGAAVATKYTALLLAAPIAAAWGLRRFRASAGARDRTTYLVYAALAATATFLAANPYFFVTPGKYYEISIYVLKLLSRENVPEWALHFEETTPYLYYFTHILPYGLGPPLLLLGVVGTIRAAIARGRSDLLLLSLPIVYFAVVGAAHHRFIRYGVPLMPFFCLFAARAIQVGSGSAARRRLAGVVGALVLIPTAAYALAYMNIYARPDSRNDTAAWVHENVPPGSTVLIEWDKVINRPIDFDRYHRPVATLEQYEQVVSGVDARGVASVRELLSNADYIILTERHAFRYLRLPERFPEAARFYRDLLDEKLGYEIVFHAAPYPRLFGYDIRDEGAEQTFREFDHPHVWVLKYRGPASGVDDGPVASAPVEGMPPDR